ncbi:MAG TPA: SDR family oxidoreductase [Acidimicrobiales bacterium]|nr:SDR family oxidoreductase [Acidimicrobiales bacterium]
MVTQRFSTLDAKHVIVVHGASPIGRAISLGLSDHGATVGVVETGLDTRADYERAFAEISAASGPPSTIVVPVLPGGTRQLLVELPLDAWIADCERPLRETRNAVQAAFTAMARPHGQGGCVVLVAATAALTGETGLAAYATAAEGARAMARVVGRGWGAHGITLHWVGAPTALFTGEDDAPQMAMWNAALGRGPDPRRDLASAIAALASPAMAFTTGTTTVVDGGLVMPT